MKVNRRSVLIGLGAAGIGTGAVFGSGAFTSVEADREATFEVTNDGNALLGLDGDGDYVAEEGDNENTIEFTFEILNDDATSTFEGALTILNNTEDGGDKDVHIEEEEDEQGNLIVGDVVDFKDTTETEGSLVGSDNAATLSPNDDITLDIVIDTNKDGVLTDVDTITVVGEDTGT